MDQQEVFSVTAQAEWQAIGNRAQWHQFEVTDIDPGRPRQRQ